MRGGKKKEKKNEALEWLEGGGERNSSDEAGKRRLGKGAKPTVFFVARIFALCRQDLFALLYLSAPPRAPSLLSFSLSRFFLAQRLLQPSPTTVVASASPLPSRRHVTDRLVVAAAYIPAHDGSLARLLQALFRHGIFTNIQDGGIISPAFRKSRRRGRRVAARRGPLFASKHSALSLSSFHSQRRFLLTSPSSSSSSSSSLYSLWALCRNTARTWVTAKATRPRSYFPTSTVRRGRVALSRNRRF